MDNWEEDELENPLGNPKQVFNSLTSELTIRSIVMTADGEYVLWRLIRSWISLEVLLEGVKSIDDREFYRCMKIKFIQIPKTEASIGKQGFVYCWGLVSITLTASVETLGANLLDGCEMYCLW